MARIERITLPSGSTYDVGANGAYSVKGTQSSSTATWTGTLDGVGALEDGLTIAYYLPYTSASNVTLNLTINGTATGAIDVYYNGNTRMGTQYPAGSTILLTYYSANSISIDGTAITTARWTSGDATSTAPGSSTPEDVSTSAGSVGSSTDYARADHVHKLEVATAVTSGDTKPVTSDAVATAIASLPEPMVFKGTVGDSGDNPTVAWENLPSPSSSGSSKNIGWTYKVISDHSTSPVCEAGDVIVSDGTNWVVVPAGDEPAGTVTNVAAGVGLTTASGSPITSTGTMKAHLKSETALTGAATNATETSGRVYATAVDSNGDLATVVPWTDTTYTANNSNITTVDSFTANTPTAVTLPTYTVSNNVLTISAGSVTAGSAASLTTGTESVTTGITAN